MSAAPEELSFRILAAAIADMPRTWPHIYGRCTGTTKRGAQCTRNGESGLEGGDPVCWSHTGEDRRTARKGAEREARLQAFQQLPPDKQEDLLRRTQIFTTASPACWSWPGTAPTEQDYQRMQRTELEQHGYTGTALTKLWELEQAVPFTAMKALSMWQAGRCAVCEQAGAELVIDHDHATGLVRGLLCRSCNTREGFSYAPRGGRDVYMAYRERPPTVILGLTIRYLDPFTGEYAEPERQRAADEWDDNAAAGLT